MKKLYEFLSADMVAEEVKQNGQCVSFIVAISQIANNENKITMQEKIDFIKNLRSQIEIYDLVDNHIGDIFDEPAIIAEVKDRYLHISIFKI